MDRLQGGGTGSKGLTRRRGVALAIAAVLIAGVAGGLRLASTDRSGLPANAGGPAATDRTDAAQMAAAGRLGAASRLPAEFRFDAGFLRGFNGIVHATGATPVDRARSFLADHADLYGLTDPAIEIQVKRDAAIAGLAHAVTFSQTYAGLPVQGGELVVQVVGEDVVGTTGALLHDYAGSRVAAFGAIDAERFARVAVKAEEARILGRTTLVILDQSLWIGGASTARLAWRVTVGTPYSALVFVDALTGEVLSEEPLGQEDALDVMDLDMWDAENDSSAKFSDCYWNADESSVGDEDGLEDEYQNFQDAIDAWNFVTGAYAFYYDTFGRDSWDGDNDEVNVYIRALVPNARFTACDDGLDAIEFRDNFMAFDVAVHEFTHGVIYFTSDLSSNWPSQALNESLSDVMGAFADGNWTNGEGVDPWFLNGRPALRSLSNPPSINKDPDRWSERTGEAHADGGISNKAAWLLTVGGQHPDTGVTVKGIGTTKAKFIYYWVLQNLPSNASFFDLRDSMVNTATMFDVMNDQLVLLGWPQLGITANDVCQVRNAFGAVELGNIDENCDGVPEKLDWDDDTLANPVDNCPIVANTDQADDDGDGIGNLCDPSWLKDTDHDGLKDWEDNCVQFPNPAQVDEDKDGLGVPCDQFDSPDVDKDGVLNEADNCPFDPNTTQADMDNDGEGDACDTDTDGDTWSNDNDICPFTADKGQEDSDGDKVGDACDKCPTTAEEVTSWTMGHPEFGIDPKPNVPDSDGDGVPDACDGRPWGLAINVPDKVVAAGGLDAKALGDSTTINFATGQGSVPILVCDPAPCKDAPAANECVGIVLSALVDGLGVAITDDRGLGAGSARNGETRSLRFQPRGGSSYFLTLSGAPSVADVDVQVQFVPCELKEERPPQFVPGGPSSSAPPSPGPSQASGTPKPPSATQKPTPTPNTAPPTPKLKPTPTPRPTPTPTPKLTPCPVPIPIPVTPADGSTVGSAKPELAWRYPSATCPPLRQRIQVATDRQMRELVYDQGLASAVTSWTPPAFLENCTWFYWRVIPIGSDGRPDPPSQIVSFLVKISRTC